MSTGEIASLVVSAVAACLGILAIWLSIVFYKMSTQLSESTREAAKDISSGVERLEKLFGTFYSDTFSIVKDTYADMLKHAWPQETDKIAKEAEHKADEKVTEIKGEISDELKILMDKQTHTDAKIDRLSQLNKEFQFLLDKAINESRKAEVEARKETVREHIVSFLKESRKDSATGVSVKQLLGTVGLDFPGTDILNELFEMRKVGIVTWPGGGDSIRVTDIIQLC